MAPLWVNEIGDRFVDESVFRIWSYAGNALIRQEKTYAILDLPSFASTISRYVPGSEAGYCIYSGRIAAQEIAKK